MMKDGTNLVIYTVDAFTSVPFHGNPAAVCILQHGRQVPDDQTLQKIANEMSLSETAFVYELDSDSASKGNRFRLRWFTPTCEINLCGHATLASATVLFREYNNCNEQIQFDTLSGVLTARKDGEMIALDLPLGELTEQVPEAADTIIQNISTELWDKKSELVVLYSPPTQDLLVRIPDSWGRKGLESLPIPDPALMLSVHNGSKIKGVILTTSNAGVSSSNRPYDFVSRYFAPWYGVAEDPVTGAAHTILGRYWPRVLNKMEFYCRQCSRRGGDLAITVNETTNRITLAGYACVVLAGQLHL